MSNLEQIYKSQLARKRAKSKQSKIKKAGSPTIAKNPIFQLLIPFGIEVGTAGLAPAWTGYVIYTYCKEKKIKGSANLAEYLIIGGFASAIDAINLLGLFGVLLIFSFAFTIPGFCILWAWRAYKRTSGF